MSHNSGMERDTAMILASTYSALFTSLKKCEVKFTYADKFEWEKAFKYPVIFDGNIIVFVSM